MEHSMMKWRYDCICRMQTGLPQKIGNSNIEMHFGRKKFVEIWDREQIDERLNRCF